MTIGETGCQTQALPRNHLFMSGKIPAISKSRGALLGLGGRPVTHSKAYFFAFLRTWITVPAQ